MIKKLLNFFSLFGSIGTLLCCALPATLVTLGMGATFASITSNFPQLIVISQHKGKLFIGTGILLVVSFFLQKQSDKLSCPIDPGQREACETSKKFSGPTYWISVTLYLVSISFAYIIPKVFYGL